MGAASHAHLIILGLALVHCPSRDVATETPFNSVVRPGRKQHPAEQAPAATVLKRWRMPAVVVVRALQLHHFYAVQRASLAAVVTYVAPTDAVDYVAFAKKTKCAQTDSARQHQTHVTGSLSKVVVVATN